jgi:hypothetical protein
MRELALTDGRFRQVAKAAALQPGPLSGSLGGDRSVAGSKGGIAQVSANLRSRESSGKHCRQGFARFAGAHEGFADEEGVDPVVAHQGDVAIG